MSQVGAGKGGGVQGAAGPTAGAGVGGGAGVQLSVREIGGVVLSALTAFAVVGSRTTEPVVS